MTPLKEEDMTTVNHFALYLILLKFQFLRGNSDQVSKLKDKIKNFSQTVTTAMKGLTTYWAYFYYISRLEPFVNESHPPIYIVGKRVPLVSLISGDSHVLSPAWRTVQVNGQPRTIVPKVVTGLKAWHLHPDYKFLTNSVANEILEQLSR